MQRTSLWKVLFNDPGDMKSCTFPLNYLILIWVIFLPTSLVFSGPNQNTTNMPIKIDQFHTPPPLFPGTKSPFQVILPNPLFDVKTAIEQELLGNTKNSFKLPDLPRSFTKDFETEFIDSNTRYGMSVNAIAKNLSAEKAFSTAANAVGIGPSSFVNAGFSYTPYNYNYRYTFSVELVAMSSYRPGSSDLNIPEGTREEIYKDNETILRNLIYYDIDLDRAFFLTNETYPMVGFCYVEAKVEVAESSEFGLNFIVGAATEADGKTRGRSHGLFSNYFKIESHVPVEHYLQTYCKKHFVHLARPYVETDFNMLVREMNVHNPKNDCIIKRKSPPEGDNDCMPWFSKLDPTTKKTSVPRCEYNQNLGKSVCVLKSKPGASCPLFMDEKGRITTEHQRYNQATVSGNSFECDDGLYCSLDSKPWSLFNMIYVPGYASCKKR